MRDVAVLGCGRWCAVWSGDVVSGGLALGWFATYLVSLPKPWSCDRSHVARRSRKRVFLFPVSAFLFWLLIFDVSFSCCTHSVCLCEDRVCNEQKEEKSPELHVFAYGATSYRQPACHITHCSAEERRLCAVIVFIIRITTTLSIGATVIATNICQQLEFLYDSRQNILPFKRAWSILLAADFRLRISA